MKLNWEPFRNWFGFTRRERRSSFILLLIVLLILILRVAVPEKNISIEDVTDSISAVITTENQSAPAPFSFDPNIASYDTLRRVGFDEKEAATLISYRNKGGKFRKPADLKKISAITSEKAEQIIPFVEVKSDTIKKNRVSYKAYRKPLIDLNKCDTALLSSLPGIGRVLSARIIKYRNLLGGYVSVNQLQEVYGLPPATFEIIRGRVFADSTAVQRIKINSSGFKELSRLPYLEKYEVTSILKYLELEKKINSIKELTDNKLITDKKAVLIKPYINFE
jgi:DNA uptake protein ComE-like DNA-binding protein